MSDRTLALGSLDPACELPNVTTSPTERIGSQPRPASSVPSRIPGWRFVAALDVSLVTSALIAVLVTTNGDRMPHGLDEFLSMRVTLKNVILLAVFMASTFAVFIFVGLYDAPRLRSWGDEMRRALAGVTLATAVADIVPLTSTSGAFVASSLLRFWLVAAASLAVARYASSACAWRAPRATPRTDCRDRQAGVANPSRTVRQSERAIRVAGIRRHGPGGRQPICPAAHARLARDARADSRARPSRPGLRRVAGQVPVPTNPGDPSGVRTSRCEGDLSR